MKSRFVCLALLLALAGPAVGQRESSQAADRAAFERGLRLSAGAAFFSALERNYPQDSRRMIDRLFSLVRANRTNVAAIAPAVAQEVAAFIRSKAGDISNAPAAALLRVIRLKLEFMRRVRAQDVGLCGRLAAQNPGDVIIMPAALRAQAVEINISLIDAAGAGSRGAALPGRSAIAEQDREAYLVAMQQIDVDGTLVPLMMDPAGRSTAAAEQQCAIGLMVYQAVLDLPEAIAGNVAAQLLVMEFGTQPGAVQTVR